MARFLLTLFLSTGLIACATPPPSALDLPPEGAMVMVKTARLPDTMDWYTRFAHHAWLEVRLQDGQWQRVEIIDEWSPPRIQNISQDTVLADYRWRRPVDVLEVLTGASAQAAGERVLELARQCEEFGVSHARRQRAQETGADPDSLPMLGRGYQAWPGPNSNSFVAWVVENTPNLHAELDHNAVGKDATLPFRAGLTTSGYGVEIDSAYLGAGIGLRQGAELRLAGLTFGIGLWPPALKLPFLPRLGFDPGVVGAAGAFVSPEQHRARQ